MQELKAAFEVSLLMIVAPHAPSQPSVTAPSHPLAQVFVPKAQQEKVDPKILVAFLTQVQQHLRAACAAAAGAVVSLCFLDIRPCSMATR